MNLSAQQPGEKQVELKYLQQDSPDLAAISLTK
jgi:hypothetical protein